MADYHTHATATATIAGQLNYQTYNNMAVAKGLEVVMAETNTGEWASLTWDESARRGSGTDAFSFVYLDRSSQPPALATMDSRTLSSRLSG